MENRSGLVVQAQATQVVGASEPAVGLDLATACRARQPATKSAVSYPLSPLRVMRWSPGIPHVAQNRNEHRDSAIDDRTTRHAGLRDQPTLSEAGGEPRRPSRPSRPRRSSVGCSNAVRRSSLTEKQVDPHDSTFEACPGFTHVAARRLADPPQADRGPVGSNQSVTLLIAKVATEVYRQLLRPDLHRLEQGAFHGALSAAC